MSPEPKETEGGGRERVVSLEEAARRLGLSRSTLQRMLRQGKLRGFKVGRQWRFRQADLDAFSRASHPAAAEVKVTEVDEALGQLGPRLESPAEFALEPVPAGYPATEEEKAIERVLKAILWAAVKAGASDVHIDATRRDAVVRHRVDGVLHELMHLPRYAHAALVAGIKVHAGMSPGQDQSPQEGRFHLRCNGKEYDIRAATLPAVLGESVAMRVLDHQPGLLTLDHPHLGMSERDLARYRAALAAPTGMIIAAGPTGCGKTSLVYAGLQEVAKPDLKVVSVEDPVEFPFPWVTQVSVNPRAGLGFEQALRGALRMDPDVVMVGDLRTQPVADLAVQIAMTGHLVLGVLHADSALGAIQRLLDIGVESFALSQSLICVIGMRLARLVCEQCGQPDEPAFSILSPLAERARAGGYELPEQPRFRRGIGCDACRRTGYRGRTGLYEVLAVTPEISRLVAARAPLERLREAAVKAGMTTLVADGLRKAAEGITSVAEVARLLPQDDW